MPEVQNFVADQRALVELQDAFRPDVTHLHSQLPEYSTLRMPSGNKAVVSAGSLRTV